MNDYIPIVGALNGLVRSIQFPDVMTSLPDGWSRAEDDEAPLDTVAVTRFRSKRHSRQDAAVVRGVDRRPAGGVSSSRRHSTDRQWLYRFPHLSARARGVRRPTATAFTCRQLHAARPSTKQIQRRAGLSLSDQRKCDQRTASGVTDSVTVLQDRAAENDALTGR